MSTLTRGTRTEPVSLYQRVGGRYAKANCFSGYEVWTEEYFTPGSGPLLTSELRGGLHAPVLDIDRPVSIRGGNGGTTLVVPDLDAAAAGRVARKLTRRRIAAREWTKTGDGMWLRGFGPWHRGTILDEVPIDLGVPLLLYPSSTPGHHHLYVEDAMTWRRAQALAYALTPVVDPYWQATLREQGRMIIRPATSRQAH